MNPTITISRDVFDRVMMQLKEDIQNYGPCDHSVGICVCELIRLVEDFARGKAR